MLGATLKMLIPSSLSTVLELEHHTLLVRQFWLPMKLSIDRTAVWAYCTGNMDPSVRPVETGCSQHLTYQILERVGKRLRLQCNNRFIIEITESVAGPYGENSHMSENFHH